jgi:hypothetical protein
LRNLTRLTKIVVLKLTQIDLTLHQPGHANTN